MSRKKQLRKLSKNELIRRYLKLEKDLNKIKNYLKAFDNPHTPSSKKLKKNTKKEEEKEEEEGEKKKGNEKRFPGKPKGSNGGGIKLPEPDEVVEHKLDTCPISGLPLGEPVDYIKRTIIDFPDKPIKTTEHRIMKYISPVTGEIVTKDVNLTNGFYGKNIQSIVAMLKNFTNSHYKIADFMRELGAPSFSSTTVQNISTMFILNMEKERNKIIKEMRNEPYIHADETGFRKDGQNGYIWAICTKIRAAFLAARGRSRKNIVKLLRNFKGVIVVDGYNAYDIFSKKQRCWAHLIRTFKDYTEDNPEILTQYKRLKSLYEKLKILNTKPPDEKEIKKAKWILNDIVTCLKPINGTSKLITLIKNGGNNWFTALYHKGVPLTNNHAERELRPIVLLRKTIGCYRNWKGKRWIDVVVSILHTWKLQGKNLFKNLKLYAC